MKTIKYTAGRTEWATFALIYSATGNVQVACGSLAQAKRALKFYGEGFEIVKVI
jgi:hypothetical protein